MDHNHINMHSWTRVKGAQTADAPTRGSKSLASFAVPQNEGPKRKRAWLVVAHARLHRGTFPEAYPEDATHG